MKSFMEVIFCPRCKRMTEHRIYFCHLWGDAPDMYVQVGELCTRVLSITGVGKNRKVNRCLHYRDMMLPVKDYNSLVKMAKEDFPDSTEDD